MAKRTDEMDAFKVFEDNDKKENKDRSKISDFVEETFKRGVAADYNHDPNMLRQNQQQPQQPLQTQFPYQMPIPVDRLVAPWCITSFTTQNDPLIADQILFNTKCIRVGDICTLSISTKDYIFNHAEAKVKKISKDLLTLEIVDPIASDSRKIELEIKPDDLQDNPDKQYRIYLVRRGIF